MEPASSASAEGVLCSVLGLDHMKSYLDELDLIRLMSTSRATRRVAAPELNRLENDVAARSHAEMFRRFLRQPEIDEEWYEHILRGAAIQVNADEIEKRIAILHCERFYGHEESTVAIFNGRGVYVGIYRFRSHQGSSECGYDGSPFFPSFEIWSSGIPPASWREWLEEEEATAEIIDSIMAERASDSKWKTLLKSGLYCDVDWVEPSLHYGLFESFKEILLSPDEAVFVLMHALSSQRSNITVYSKEQAFCIGRYLEDPEYEVDLVVKYWLRKCREAAVTNGSQN